MALQQLLKERHELRANLFETYRLVTRVRHGGRAGYSCLGTWELSLHHVVSRLPSGPAAVTE